MRLTHEQKFDLLKRIDSFPVIRGAGVVYCGDGLCDLLRNSDHSSSVNTYVFMEEQNMSMPQKGPSNLAWSRVKNELPDFALNCGGLIPLVLADGAEAGAAIPTMGATTPMLIATTVVTGAAYTQCAVSISRIGFAIKDPELVDYLDSSEWYHVASSILDGIALGAIISDGFKMIKTFKQIQRTTGKSFFSILRDSKMNHAERKLFAKEMAEASTQVNTRKELLKLAQENKIPKILTQKQVDKVLQQQIYKSIGAGLGVTGSARSEDGVGNKAAKLAISIVQEK